jgi:hypothetical protein
MGAGNSVWSDPYFLTQITGSILSVIKHTVHIRTSESGEMPQLFIYI